MMRFNVAFLAALCAIQSLGVNGFVVPQHGPSLQTKTSPQVGVSSTATTSQSRLYMITTAEVRQALKGNALGLPAAPAVAIKQEISAAEQQEENKQNSLTFCHSLALNSGILNGIFLSGIMGKVQAVGPVTDSWTKSALGFAHGDIVKAFFILKVLASFSAGAFTQGLINPKMDVFDISSKVRTKPFLIASSMMGLATYLVLNAAATGARVAPAAAFFLVCATNGLQNSFSSFLTANQCRTSHFTGTTTDLMTIFAQCVRGNTANAYKIKTYVGLTIMFFGGGYLGTKWTTDLTKAAMFMGASSAWFFVSALPWGKLKAKFSKA